MRESLQSALAAGTRVAQSPPYTGVNMRFFDPIIVLSLSASVLSSAQPAFAAAGICDSFARNVFETQIIPRDTNTDVLERADMKLAAMAMKRLPFQIQPDGTMVPDRS